MITLTPAAVYFIGRAFVRFLQARGGGAVKVRAASCEQLCAPVPVPARQRRQLACVISRACVRFLQGRGGGAVKARLQPSRCRRGSAAATQRQLLGTFCFGRRADAVQQTTHGQVCVGSDPRLSGPLLRSALLVGLADEGAEVRLHT